MAEDRIQELEFEVGLLRDRVSRLEDRLNRLEWDLKHGGKR